MKVKTQRLTELPVDNTFVCSTFLPHSCAKGESSERRCGDHQRSGGGALPGHGQKWRALWHCEFERELNSHCFPAKQQQNCVLCV